MRVLVLASLVLISCGGSVSPEAATVPDSGAISTETGQGTTTPGAGGAADGGAAGPAATCSRTSDRVDISIELGGRREDCTTRFESPEPFSFTGQVVATDVSSISVDQCHPAADCIPRVAVITAKAPGLNLTQVKKNTFVQIDARVSRSSFSCTTQLTVRAVAEWGGMKNPVEGAKTYLVASDGTFGNVGPLTVGRVPTGCFKATPPICGPGEADWFSLAFSAAGSGAAVTIPMGQTATFAAAGQTFTARNLRSYFEGLCDAYWDYAWWATSFE